MPSRNSRHRFSAAPGDTFARRYEIVRKIGSGGMGTVYEAKHVDLGTRVAIKVLAVDALATEDARARFVREARVAAQLRSVHVAKVVDVDVTDDDRPFMVLELLEGNDLSVEIARGPLPVPTAVDYARQALEALGEAHRYGIVHRDVKPANLFVCRAPPGVQRRAIKVLDFGIAKVSGGERLTATTDSFGTPQYMSPEQIRAVHDVGPASDLWSMGVVLYECLTGRLPYEGNATRVIASIVAASVPPPRRFRQEIPPGLEAVVMKALEKDEAKRYATAKHFRDALATWAPRGTISAEHSKIETALTPPLGTLLVQDGKITPAQLAAALERQRAAPERRLGDLLVEMGATTPEEITAALARAAAPVRSAPPTKPTLPSEEPGARGPAPTASPAPTSGPEIATSPTLERVTFRRARRAGFAAALVIAATVAGTWLFLRARGRVGRKPGGTASGSVTASGSALPPSFVVPSAWQQRKTQRAVDVPEAPLASKWSTRVGRTTFRTTMAMSGGHLVIGTHRSVDDASADGAAGVHVLDAATGKQVRRIEAPGKSDDGVEGIAVDGADVVFSTESGHVVKASLSTGAVAWAVKVSRRVRPAPALGDFDGKGARDVAIGDDQGVLHALSGDDGSTLWTRDVGAGGFDSLGFVAAPAIGDLDGTGPDDVVAACTDGPLVAYHGRDGSELWRAGLRDEHHGMHASPSLVDVDDDGRAEVLASWSDSRVALFDAPTGALRYEQPLVVDDVFPEGLVGSAVPLPIRDASGLIVQPTAWSGRRRSDRVSVDGLVFTGQMGRQLKSVEGPVSATPVVMDLHDRGAWSAVVGTEHGDVVAVEASGTRRVLARLGAPIEASPLVADVDSDGAYEIIVATTTGTLTCLATASRTKPLVSRFRGETADNRGDFRTIKLGWRHADASEHASTQRRDDDQPEHKP